MTFKSLWQQLLPQYDAREAQAVVRLALETLFGFTLTDLYTGALDRLNPAQTQQLSALMHRLKHGEPVQYVLGKLGFVAAHLSSIPTCSSPDPKQNSFANASFRCPISPIAPCNRLHLATG